MQQLQLTALQCPPPELPESIQVRFGESGGRIGRHRTCELPLPDPERHISREHAEIRWRDGAFVLRVLSKVNGVLINGRPVEPGETARLADGDRIQVGAYVLQARLVQGQVQDAAQPPADDPFAFLSASPVQRGGASPFDALKELILDSTGAPAATAPRSEAFTGSALAPAPARSEAPAVATPDLEAWSIEDIDRILGVGGAAPAASQPGHDPDASGTNINGAAFYRAHDIELPFNVPAQPGTVSTAAANSGAEFVHVLAEALGLQPGELDDTRPQETIRLAGTLLKAALEGLYKMLEMRAQLKSELRIEDRTMIASRENNPLKHGDLHDALTYLVDVRQHGNKLFMAPQKSVQDAVWDVCAHEMAVMAGTRAALLASLKLFSPDNVEGRIKKSGALDAVLPAFHKSKLWEQFLEMHSALEREAEDHFDQLLNQEFAKAYAEQSRRLRKKP